MTILYYILATGEYVAGDLEVLVLDYGQDRIDTATAITQAQFQQHLDDDFATIPGRAAEIAALKTHVCYKLKISEEEFDLLFGQ